MAALDGLIEFVSAVESGSFSAAARLLGVSVAHVSRSVANLERRLGLQLIQRTSRRSAVTEAGRLYHASCRALLDGLDEAREALRQDQDQLRGTIRISVGGHFGEDHVSPLLLRFGTLHPAITLDIEVSSRNVDLVEDGIDLAVRAGPLIPSSLIARRLTAYPLVTLISPALLERLGEQSHPDALDKALCLGLGRRRWAFQHGSDRYEFTPQGRVLANNGATLIQAAVASLGMVQVPGYYGRAEIASGTLKVMLPDWAPAEPFEFHIVYAPQQRLPRRVRQLIDFLVAGMQQAAQDPVPE